MIKLLGINNRIIFRIVHYIGIYFLDGTLLDKKRGYACRNSLLDVPLPSVPQFSIQHPQRRLHLIFYLVLFLETTFISFLQLVKWLAMTNKFYALSYSEGT